MSSCLKEMKLKTILEKYNGKIVSDWFVTLTSDPDSCCDKKTEQELLPLINEAAKGFYEALVADRWERLDFFITRVAHKSFAQGFKVSDIQKTFEIYRRLLIPLMITHMDKDALCAQMLRLQECMVSTVTRFSEYFQNIHDEFIKSHAESLEKEVSRRTRELAHSKQKYKILVEDINDGYFVLVKGKIVFANRSFAQMHGWFHHSVLKSDFLDFVAPESHDKVKAAYRSSLTGKQSSGRIEYLRRYKDGRMLPTEIIAKQSLFEKQATHIGICRDISERISLGKKIHEAKKLITLAKQAGSLAHEIKNPMSAVKMNLQMFEQTEQDPVKRQLIGTSLDEITRIDQSLLEMMNLSIPYRLEKKHVSIRRLLENAMAVMHQRIANNNLQVSVRLGRQIDIIKIDPQRIEQAVLNLLFNAIEAQPNSGKIYLSSRQVKQGKRALLEITVGNNGPGVSKKTLPHLFDPVLAHKVNGNGIGLKNVKRIVEAHSGEVDVKPRRFMGTNFFIRLPLE